MSETWPDAGFPADDPMNWRARSFCLRLLTDADAEHYAMSRLYLHFERHGSDAWAEWEYGGLDEAMGIVWSATRLRTVAAGLPAHAERQPPLPGRELSDHTVGG